jgi:hypothetical protein
MWPQPRTYPPSRPRPVPGPSGAPGSTAWPVPVHPVKCSFALAEPRKLPGNPPAPGSSYPAPSQWLPEPSCDGSGQRGPPLRSSAERFVYSGSSDSGRPRLPVNTDHGPVWRPPTSERSPPYNRANEWGDLLGVCFSLRVNNKPHARLD